MGCRSGSATVELIIVMPFLLLIVLGGLDLGRVIVAKVALAGAVHVGVAEGARVIQLKEPETAWPGAPVWAYDAGTQTIAFDNKNDIITAMETAVTADVGDKYKSALNFDGKTEVVCRCLKTNTAGLDSYSNPVACNHNDIKTCVTGTGVSNAVRQIYVGMQPKLTVPTIFAWPFMPRQIVLTIPATMQGDEYP